MVEQVGDFCPRGLRNSIGRVVKGTLGAPCQGSIPRRSHTILYRLALGSQNVVDGCMGVRGSGEVVGARVHNVGFGVVGIIGGQVFAFYRNRDLFGLPGLQQLRLTVSHQLTAAFSTPY